MARASRKHQLTNADAAILRQLADLGGLKHYRPALGGWPLGMLGRMRAAGWIELLDHPRDGLCARLTDTGAAALPAALKLLAATGGMTR